MKIYEGNSQAWDFLIIRITDITFGLERQLNENINDACKALGDKYDVKNEKQESINKVTNTWNNYSIRDTSKYPSIWFNE